jgi:ParB family transcriptional regulator, chromosome partitioning protein
MAKLKGLGRGLDALLGVAEAGTQETLRNVAIDAIRRGKFQPRTRMDEDSLGLLAGSIKSQGMMQPVLVRPTGAGQYEIIAGERRWRAAQMAGLSEIPALVRDVPDDSALLFALVENIQREDLNPLEEARGIERLITEFQMTHESAAHAVGRSRSAVSNLLRLLTLAVPVQELMMQGKLNMGHARALLAVAGVKQIELANLVAHRGLSVRETERVVRRLQNAKAPAKMTIPDRDLLRLQESLSQRLGAAVAIRARGNGAGRLVIAYSSLDQLDAILARLQ